MPRPGGKQLGPRFRRVYGPGRFVSAMRAVPAESGARFGASPLCNRSGITMPNAEHLLVLEQGVDSWNAWRRQRPQERPDLERADLSGKELQGVDFSNGSLTDANLTGANLRRANFNGANLHHTRLAGAWLECAQFSGANLWRARLEEAQLTGADFSGADLTGALFYHARLDKAVLSRALASQADFESTYMAEANLEFADVHECNFMDACLVGANLRFANLSRANLVEADLRDATLTGASVYGVSAWGLKTSDATVQNDLVITPDDEARVTTDDIEVAQFVYLILHNEKIRKVVDTVGRNGVLLLGRFTSGRVGTLERLRNALRSRGYVPIVFNFDRPETKDFTETVRLLAGLSHFVIADITNPRSTPLELQAVVPEIMVPLVPILEKGEEPFAMLHDLWVKHRDWVFEPIRYSSVERLLAILDTEVIEPAESRFQRLLANRTKEMPVRDF